MTPTDATTAEKATDLIDVPTPGPAFTTTGIQLPVVALPQGELLTVNANDIPVIRDSLGPGVHFQPLRADLEAGEWAALATFSPGATIPLHYHTGPAEAFTLQGS